MADETLHRYLSALHAGKLRLPTVDELEAERSRRSLAEFVKRHWDTLEPTTALEWAWYHDLICTCLEKVARRELRGLGIAVPPGSLKSLIASVCYPCWRWLPGNNPSARSLYTSSSDLVAMRDAEKCRVLMRSERYQADLRALAAMHGVPSWQFSDTQDAKENFENTRRGCRLAVTAGQRFTGARASEVVIDDPIDVQDVINRPVDRVGELMDQIGSWYDQKLWTRRNDLRTDPIVLIMQRLHQRDLFGRLLERNGGRFGWEFVVLPLSYDPDHAHPDDPRTEPGQCLDPGRFPPEVVEEARKTLREQYHAQYEQAPVPTEGGMYKRAWFDRGRYPWRGGDWRENGAVPSLWRRGLFADTANKTKNLSDWSVMVHAGQDEGGDVWVLGLWRRRVNILGLFRMASEAVVSDDPDFFLVELAGSGIQLAPMLKDAFPSLSVLEETPTPVKDRKIMRAANNSHWWETGRVHLPDDAPWVVEFVAEYLSFPGGSKDDQVDAFSSGLQYFHDRRKRFRRSMVVGGEIVREDGSVASAREVLDPGLRPRLLGTLGGTQQDADQGALLWRGVRSMLSVGDPMR